MTGTAETAERATYLVVGDLPRLNAERNPSGIAYVAASGTWTWSQIDARVERLAHFLRKGLGIAPGAVVGILAENGIEHVELMFAASRAKLIHTALKTRGHNKERIRQAADAGLAALLVGTGFETAAKEIQAELGAVVLVGFDGAALEISLDDAPAVPSTERMLSHRDPDAIYSIMYTSGSTGEPKGVAISSRNELAYAWSVSWALAAADDDVFLHVLPLVHKGGQFYAMTAALMGCAVVLGSPDPASMLDAIATHKITKIIIVPTIAKRMIELLEESPGKYDVSSVRRFGIGSTALAPDLARRLCQVVPAELCQLGGASEGGLSMVLTSRDYAEILAGRAPEHRIWSCGRPVPGARVGILDERGEPVAAGETGEIVYQGNQFVHGYWNKPEASDFAWRGGWYHSGDVGYRDEDGYIYYVDRLYGRIKTGAETVYSREVESVLAAHRDVVEVAVVGIPDAHWGEKVTAAIVTRRPVADDRDRKLFETELSDLILDQLARFKIPKDYFFVEALPRTDLGKVAYGELKTQLSSTPT